MDTDVRPQLKKIAEDLAAGRVVPPVTTREFLSWFDAQRRGYWVVQSIRRELERAKLQTVPDFESTYIDELIAFRQGDQKLEEPAKAVVGVSMGPIALESTAQTPAPITLLISKDPTYRISKLAAANQRVVSVKPDATLAECMGKMLLRNFSQLPVMTNERDVKGTVSWKTIGSHLALSKMPEFARDAMVPHEEIRASASIFEAIPLVVVHDYVLVRSDDNRIIGIITATDLSEQFQQLSEPFLLLGEIENLLRSIIGDHFSVSELADARDPEDESRKVESPADLNFDEYLRLLQKPDNWKRLGLAIDRMVFCTDLDAIRGIRNNVMHFDPEGIVEDDLRKLRTFTNFLKQLQGVLGRKHER
jgi:CBS domain-containing protein